MIRTSSWLQGHEDKEDCDKCSGAYPLPCEHAGCDGWVHAEAEGDGFTEPGDPPPASRGPQCSKCGAAPADTRPPDLVLDSNVLLLIWSIHDLTKEAEKAEKAEKAGAGSGALPAGLENRRQRAQDALMCAMACERDGLATGSLKSEPLRIIQERVPPGDHSLDAYYVQVFWHFVKDYILPNWHCGLFNAVNDRQLSGDACDDEYLRVAQENGLPLVTDEGNSPDGIRETTNRGKRNLRGKAKDAGVQVFTPGEFWQARGLDPAEAKRVFFDRFDRHRSEYVRSRDIDDDKMEEVLDDLRRIFEWVLG